MSNLEESVASISGRVAMLEASVAGVNKRLDRVEHRLDRIETRLELIDAWRTAGRRLVKAVQDDRTVTIDVRSNFGWGATGL